jgi:hypothetical protein
VSGILTAQNGIRVTGDRVGINSVNATEPTAPLEIRSASTVQTNTGHIVLSGDGATVGEGPQIMFNESGGGSSYAGAYIGHIRQGSNSIGDLVFGTRGSTGDASTIPTERLRITSGGKVFLPGTQTDSDEAGRLDIYHTADDGINNPHIRLWGPANQDARIEFGSPTNTGEGGYIMYNDSDEGLYIGSRMGGYGEVNLCTGMNDGSPISNIRLRVTSGGNVEIANGNLVFSTSGTGIDFSATSDGSGTTTSELLDDYEEGTWTPTITFGGGATGLTYTRQYGKYVKIGNVVTISGHFQINAKGSSTGHAVVSGLPFSYPAITGGYFVPMGVRGRLNVGGAESVSFFVSSGGGSSLPIYSCDTSGGGNSSVNQTAFTTSTEIDIHATYHL